MNMFNFGAIRAGTAFELHDYQGYDFSVAGISFIFQKLHC